MTHSFPTRRSSDLVMRLSRKVIAGIGAVGALALVGALTFALQSRDTKPPAELYNTDNRAVTERVASGPRDYAALPPGVPQLGAPLPGDLGGPIVSAQQRGETVPLPPIGADAGQPNTGATPEEQARQSADKETEAGLASRLFLCGQSDPAPVGQTGWGPGAERKR